MGLRTTSLQLGLRSSSYRRDGEWDVKLVQQRIVVTARHCFYVVAYHTPLLPRMSRAPVERNGGPLSVILDVPYRVADEPFN